MFPKLALTHSRRFAATTATAARRAILVSQSQRRCFASGGEPAASVLPLALAGVAVAATGGTCYSFSQNDPGQSTVSCVPSSLFAVSTTKAAARDDNVILPLNTKKAARALKTAASITEEMKGARAMAHQDHQTRLACIQADRELRRSVKLRQYNDALLEARALYDATAASVADSKADAVNQAVLQKAEELKEAATRGAENVRQEMEKNSTQLQQLAGKQADNTISQANKKALQTMQKASFNYGKAIERAEDALDAAVKEAGRLTGQARQDAVDKANRAYKRTVNMAQAVKEEVHQEAIGLMKNAAATADKIKGAQLQAVEVAESELVFAEVNYLQAVSEAWKAYDRKTAHLLEKHAAAKGSAREKYDKIIQAAQEERCDRVAKAEKDRKAVIGEIEATKQKDLAKAQQVEDGLSREMNGIMDRLSRIKIDAVDNAETNKSSILASIEAGKKAAKNTVRCCPCVDLVEVMCLMSR